MTYPTYELTRCPVCDTLESVQVADADALRAEVELLWAFHERRLKTGVPPQCLTDRLAFSQHPPLRLSQCEACEHVYRNPWETRETLKAAYAGTTLTDDVLQGLFATQHKASRAQARRLTRMAGRAGRGLEVGSYVGGFLAAARDAGWTFQGVDVNPDASAFAAGKGFRVTRGEIADVDASRRFDAVAVWNTFEQLYDARAALVSARGLLLEGGIIALRIPNGRYYLDWRERLAGPMGRIATCLLAHNNLLTFPYRQGFTRRSIGALLAKCGFAIVGVFGDTLVPVADRWTTRYGRLEERWVKRVQRLLQPGWRSPWIEVYARALPQ